MAVYAGGLQALLSPWFQARLGCQQIDCPAMDAVDCPRTESILGTAYSPLQFLLPVWTLQTIP